MTRAYPTIPTEMMMVNRIGITFLYRWIMDSSQNDSARLFSPFSQYTNIILMLVAFDIFLVYYQQRSEHKTIFYETLGSHRVNC